MTLAIIFDSVGIGEWLVLLAVLLVVVGPKRLPKVTRELGQYYAKFRRVAEGFKRQLMEMETEVANAGNEIVNAGNEIVNAGNEVVDAVSETGIDDMRPRDMVEIEG